MSDEDAEQAYIPPREAAKLLGVSVRTLSRMAESHEIEAIKFQSGHRRYLRRSIEQKTQSAA